MIDWSNKLNFEERRMVVQLYLGGVSISAITKIYQVHHSSIHYHLKKAGVYVVNRKPVVSFNAIQKANINSALDFHNNRGQKLKVVPKKKVFCLGYDDEEQHFPKSYAEYVQRDKQRSRLKLKQHASTR